MFNRHRGDHLFSHIVEKRKRDKLEGKNYFIVGEILVAQRAPNYGRGMCRYPVFCLYGARQN